MKKRLCAVLFIILLSFIFFCACNDTSSPIKVDEVEPHTVHTYSQWVIEVKPTCTTSGKRYRTCNVCDKREDSTTKALGHEYGDWETVQEPTTEAEGLRVKKCIRCTEKIEESIPKHVHSFGEWKTVENEDCINNGKKVRLCSCGVKEEGVIKAKGHNFETKVQSPTCTEQGYNLKTCKNCNYEEYVSFIKPKGHSYNTDGYCADCNVHQSEFFSYREINDGTEYCLTGTSSIDSTNLVLLSTYNDKPVTEIAAGAFKSDLISITLPDTIRYISPAAFSTCYSLQKTLKNGAYYIGNWLIEGEQTLSEITIDDCIGIVGNAFASNRQLSKVIISDTVKYIGENAFGSSSSYPVYLMHKTIPEGFDENWNFQNNCTVYLACTKIDTYTVGNDSFEYCVLEKDELLQAIIIAYKGSNLGISIPSSIDDAPVTAIAPDAFAGFENVISIEFPSSVKEIGKRAFKGMTALTTLINFPNVERIENSCFSGCESLISFTIPLSVSFIGDNAFYRCKKLLGDEFEGLIIPDGVKHIGANAFSENKALKEIHIPSDVEYVGSYCFFGCNNLTIYYPNSIPSLWDKDFNVQERPILTE